MSEMVMVGGWKVTLQQEFKLVKKGKDGLTYAQTFCIGEDAHGNAAYFTRLGYTKTLGDIFESITAMRRAYRDRLTGGYEPF